MTRRFSTLATAGGLTLLLAAPLAFAGPGRHAHGGASDDAAGRHEGRRAALADVLDLTTEQAARLDATLDGAKAEAAPLADAAHDAREALRDAVRADADDATVLALHAEVADAHRALAEVRVRTMLSVRGLLTPEQLAQAKERGVLARVAGGGHHGHVRGGHDRGGHGRGGH